MLAARSCPVAPARAGCAGHVEGTRASWREGPPTPDGATMTRARRGARASAQAPWPTRVALGHHDRPGVGGPSTLRPGLPPGRAEAGGLDPVEKVVSAKVRASSPEWATKRRERESRHLTMRYTRLVLLPMTTPAHFTRAVETVMQPEQKRPERQSSPSPEDYEAEHAEAMEANDELVERLRHGDVHALASLMEAVTGGKVTSTRIIEPSR